MYNTAHVIQVLWKLANPTPTTEREPLSIFLLPEAPPPPPLNLLIPTGFVCESIRGLLDQFYISSISLPSIGFVGFFQCLLLLFPKNPSPLLIFACGSGFTWRVWFIAFPLMAPSRKKGGAKAAAARRQWKVGDLVLAKVKGFPAWPAAVCAFLSLYCLWPNSAKVSWISCLCVSSLRIAKLKLSFFSVDYWLPFSRLQSAMIV